MSKNHITALLVLLLAVCSCFKDPNFDSGFPGADNGGRNQPERGYSEPTRRVMIMVSAGFNSLSNYLSQDLLDMEQGYLPDGTSYSDDVVLVLSRLPKDYGDYSVECPPVLYRLYKDRENAVHRDTLMIWADDTPLCQKETLHDALSFIQRKFPAKGYGLVFSSHASGWLPVGYYSDPSKYEKSTGKGNRSMGQDIVGSGSVEMEIKDFADAIPMHLDYLLLDACLSGCVEVAWEFKDKTDMIGFSPTEVLADGFDYLNITRRLLASEPDPVDVCREYFEYYNTQSGSSRSASITAVDTRKMDRLAEVCRTLFEKYRSEIMALDGNKVQGYFRYDRHYFYDLRDILVQTGISWAEREQLDAALDACLLYQAATPYFLDIRLSRVCGLSMYLPSMGTAFLNQFYQNQIGWNEATLLVK
ncbi:MAG: hypothetical protein IJP81_02695 [Bacteroidales bacterium]|nr:hypothetical protein [Bacteroidales bacterium]